MAAQDVREIVPRVRRALEGPVEVTGPTALTEAQVEAMAADAIADVILLTVGAWQHTLEVGDRNADTGVPEHWTVTPELSLPEESMIAAQAAIQWYFHQVRDLKTHEAITNEGQSWDYDLSPNLLRDQIKLLRDQRDAALAALMRTHPALARYASILEIRDRVGSALLEPWVQGGEFATGLGGGQDLGFRY